MPLFRDAIKRVEQPQVVAIIVAFSAVVFTLPFAIKQNSWAEWGTAYWGVQQQAESIAASGFPTRFVSTPESGDFYPWFVFYAGGISSLLGYIAQVIGSWGAFLLSIALAFAAATYGALLALRAFKCPPQVRLLLALAAGFSPYVVTNLYGRGSWAELLGASSAWLLAGAGLALLEAKTERQRRGRLLLVAFATSLLAVSHNISLAVGLPYAVALWAGFVLIRGVGAPGRNVRLLTGALISGLLIAGMWLLPNVAYSDRTQINLWDTFGGAASFDELRVLFSPLLYYPETQRELIRSTIGGASPPNERLFNQTLTLLLVPVAWIAAQFLIEPLRSPRKRVSRSILTTKRSEWQRLCFLLGLFLLITVLMTNQQIWEILPETVQIIQFPYRLNSYLTLTIVLCTGVAAYIVTVGYRNRAVLVISVITVLSIFYLGLAAFQALTAQRVAPFGFESATRERIEATGMPPVWANAAPPVQFQFVPEAPVQRPEVSATFLGRSEEEIPNTVGRRLATDIACSPFVEFTPAVHVIGADEELKCVLRVDEDDRSIGVSGAWPLASKLGIIASVGGLVLLGLMLLLTRSKKKSQGETSRGVGAKLGE